MVAPRTRPGPLLAIEGASGAGKSSVSAALAERLGGVLLAEAFRRLQPPPSLAFQDAAGLLRLERGLLEEEGRRWEEALRLAASGRAVVLDTGPLGPLTYSWGLREGWTGSLDVVAPLVDRARELVGERRFGLPDLTIYLDLPERVAEVRAARSPSDHPKELRERHRTVARWERWLYVREFPRRAPGRFAAVAGDGSATDTAFSILDRLEQIGRIPTASPSEAEAWLQFFEVVGTFPR